MILQRRGQGINRRDRKRACRLKYDVLADISLITVSFKRASQRQSKEGLWISVARHLDISHLDRRNDSSNYKVFISFVWFIYDTLSLLKH